MVESFSSASCSFCSSDRPSMRGMLMSLTTMSMSGFAVEHGERLDPVAGEQEADGPVADLAAKFLQNERFEVRLVVDDEDACGHAASPTRVSISSRSAAKSIGLVSSASAPFSERLALGLRVAVGGDHDHRHVRPRRLRLGQKLKPAHARHVDVGEDQDQR